MEFKNIQGITMGKKNGCFEPIKFLHAREFSLNSSLYRIERSQKPGLFLWYPNTLLHYWFLWQQRNSMVYKVTYNTLLFCRDNYFLPSWKHLWDSKTLQEISCLLHLKACGLTEILKTRLRGKCSVAYIFSFVITTALNFPAQGKFPSLLVQIARGCSLICFLIQFLIKRKSFDGRSSVCFHPGI